MKCPYCGQEMEHGYLTGSKLLRIAPEPEKPKVTQHFPRGLPASQYENGLPGLLLDVSYAGVALWTAADYCRHCEKVIFDAPLLRD